MLPDGWLQPGEDSVNAKDHSLRDFAQDLRSSAAASEWRGNWAMALLYRRPGVLFALGFARLGWHPIHITVLAFILALSMPVQAWVWPIWVSPYLVFLSGVVFQILDCADGTLARRTNQASDLGGDLDFLVDMAQWFLLYSAIGILADRTLDTGFAWTTVAVFAAWARLMARVIRDRLNTSVNDGPTELRLSDYPSLFIGGISGLIPFLALCGGLLHWAVVALLIYALLDIIEGLAPLARK